MEEQEAWKDISDLTLPQKGLICCVSWGLLDFFLLRFPGLLWPISQKDYTFLWDWPGFYLGIYLKQANETYLAISLLQLFLSGQPNESSAGDPKGSRWPSHFHSPLWNFLEQQENKSIYPSPVPPWSRLIAPRFSIWWWAFVLFWIQVSWMAKCRQTLLGRSILFPIDQI